MVALLNKKTLLIAKHEILVLPIMLLYITFFSKNRHLPWYLYSTWNFTFMALSYLVLLAQPEAETKARKLEGRTSKCLQSRNG
jgi:hypothetical protein